MKVRCIQLVDPLGAVRETSPWLTIGKEYHVLSLIYATGKWLVRLWTDDGTVGLFPLQQFEITSPKVSALWIATWNRSGVFELTTRSLAQEGFWDRYYDNEMDAIQIVDGEMKKIIGES